MSNDKPLRWARLLADVMTYVRLLGGFMLPFLAWEHSADALGRLVKINLLLWSTDAVDGKFARLSNTPSSWIGKRDIYVDTVMTIGTSLALVRAGFFPKAALGIWFCLCLIVYLIRPVATVMLAFMCPLQIALPVLALVHGCPEFNLYLLWLLIIAMVNRIRLKFVIENFINGLPETQKQWVLSWLPQWLKPTPQQREYFQKTQASDSAVVDTNGRGMSL
ncbi:MAG TPA: hypothetical protein PLW17_08315 [Limnochordia bacterium]|nr:hypothetical protein [Limnochordia bacterium]HPZ31437.1 hypothetical protein [Limnochordia bacterium]HQD71180.1 hypothetical protein [Limnochordia bacterium]